MKLDLIKGNLVKAMVAYTMEKIGFDLTDSTNYVGYDQNNELNVAAMAEFKNISDEVTTFVEEEFSRYDDEEGTVAYAEDLLEHYETLA